MLYSVGLRNSAEAHVEVIGKGTLTKNDRKLIKEFNKVLGIRPVNDVHTFKYRI